MNERKKFIIVSAKAITARNLLEDKSHPPSASPLARPIVRGAIVAKSPHSLPMVTDFFMVGKSCPKCTRKTAAYGNAVLVFVRPS